MKNRTAALFPGALCVLCLISVSCLGSSLHDDSLTGTSPRVASCVIHALAGVHLFERAYDRDPWQEGEFGIDLKRSRHTFSSSMRAQRRVYGENALYGCELECASGFIVTPRFLLTAGFSASPYTLFDTLYASGGATAGINCGFAGGIELDAALRLRWYGSVFTPTCVAGAGKYSGRFLLLGRVFIAAADKKGYTSGVAELRLFSRKIETSFYALSAAFGRSPFDAGKVTSDGFISFFELTAKTRFVTGDRISLMPLVTMGRERYTHYYFVPEEARRIVVTDPARLRCMCSVTVEYRAAKRH